jgi:hypothetical protein
MLILNTQKGDVTIAKGNIHAINQDYYDGYIYVTKDMVGYPFRRINGIKVKDIDHAYALVEQYADENGEQHIDYIAVSDETHQHAEQIRAERRANSEAIRKKKTKDDH